MKAVLQILPITLLLVGAVFAVWRGMGRKADGLKNRPGGGGPNFPGKHWRW